MRAVHILLLFLNILYVEAVEIYISTPVKIMDCGAERDEGILSVGTSTTEVPSTITEEPIDPQGLWFLL